MALVRIIRKMQETMMNSHIYSRFGLSPENQLTIRGKIKDFEAVVPALRKNAKKIG